MNLTRHVMLFDAAPERATELRGRLTERGIHATHVPLADSVDVDPGGADLAVVLLPPTRDSETALPLDALIDRLVRAHVSTILWGPIPDTHIPRGPLLECLSDAAGLDEVLGCLTTLARWAPVVGHLERELNHLQQLGDQLNRYFSEIDQEMRLAGRLQRDFLPRQLPSVPPLHFSALYRPASWVSGDLYDAFRIDERHLGVFIADAMGHGMAAGLLTMFLRQAVTTKQIEDAGYRIIEPAAVLTELHNVLARQKLPNYQFVTAAYGIVDTQALTFRVARAGHPYPLHVSPSGAIDPIAPGGALLGLPDMQPDFEEATVSLAPGEKIVLFSDGVEDVFLKNTADAHDHDRYSDTLHRWVRLDADGLIRSIADHCDHQEGSLHPADDVTVVTFEVRSGT